MKPLACALTLLSAATATAQPATTSTPPQSTLSSTAAPPLAKEEKQDKPEEPEAGDFNAGVQARFPSGPDETGDFASFNWVAVDLEGRYHLLDRVTLDASIPLAVKRPDTIAVGAGTAEPSLFGGLTLTLDARISAPKMPGIKYDTTIGLILTAGYMKQGAMLLSDKDYPLFVGDMKPGFAGGLLTKVKLSSLVDFSLVPTWVLQSGEPESLTAFQIPFTLELKLSSLAKLNAELGIYTGDNYSFSGNEGGRITTGTSLDLKLGPILLHTGAGLASLLTGGLYPTRKDSFYFDLSIKYAN